MKKLLVFLALSVSLLGTSQTTRLKEANNLYARLAYFLAAEAYEDVLDATKDSTLVSTKIADCYDRIENNEKAVLWYNFIQRTSVLNQHQLLRSAIVRRQVGDYDGSLKQLREYEQRFGSTDVTKKMILEHDRLEAFRFDDGTFSVTNQEQVNTDASEMGVSYYKDNLFFLSSSRKASSMSEQTYGRSGSKFYNIYLASKDDQGHLVSVQKFKNTVFHDGPIVYDSIHQVVYFTRNNYIHGKAATDDRRVMRLKIYRGKISDNKIVEEVELPFNSDQFSCGHPSIAADGRTLYFASDRPGGLGGSDIYRVSVDDDGTIGTPENLGAHVNTSLNEFFPSIHSGLGLLFFASEGHTGLGGLDVFYAEADPETGSFMGVKNLATPINSQADDFSFVLLDSTGFFTSNRRGGNGDDDVYRFSMKKPLARSVFVEGLLTDRQSGGTVPNATVSLFDDAGKLVATTQTDSNGRYFLPIDPAHMQGYKLVATKPNFVTVEQPLASAGQPVNGKVSQDLRIQRGLDNTQAADVLAIRLVVKDRATGEVISDAEVRMYDNVTRKEFLSAPTNANGFVYTPLEKNMYDLLSFQFLVDKKGYSPVRDLYRETYQKPGLIEIVEYLDQEKDVIGKDIAASLGIKNIYFDLDKYAIRPDAKKELDKIVRIMNEYPEMVIELGSHTDCRQSMAYNDFLSSKRAEASANYIRARITNPSRISGRGFGETRLVNDCGCEPTDVSTCTEAQHQLNRRTEFVVKKVGTRNPSAAVVVPTAEPQKKSVPASGNQEVYVVKPGETLYRVAQNTGVSVARLKELNGLKEDIIVSGQKLRLK